MTMFNSILAVYDGAIGSDAVLMKAVGLARATGAQLEIAGLFCDAPQTSSRMAEAAKCLDRIVPWVRQEGVDGVSTRVLAGTFHVEITRQVLRAGHDLVIASPETGRNAKVLAFGSTAASLIRKCPCPVWIVGSSQSPQRSWNGDILAAIQPSRALAEKICSVAAALARATNARLHVVHCWDVEDGNEAIMLRSEIRDATKHAILLKHEQMRRQEVERVLARCGQSAADVQIHLPRAAAGTSIVELAEKLDAATVVMGTDGQAGISSLVLGNAVERVRPFLRCDVVAVKPDEFRTPIPAPETSPERMRLYAH